jgi:hypothetical protein
MQQTTATLIVALAGIAGTFGSGIASQRMSRKTQRELWNLDNRKQEFRELLAALTNSYIHLLSESPLAVLDADQVRANLEAKLGMFKTVQDRILIASDVNLINIGGRWEEAVREYTKDYDVMALQRRYLSLSSDIVKSALS